MIWLSREPSADACRRLICFPHAGAGAAAYRLWASDADLEVLPVRLPGRESRYREPAPRRLRALAEEVAGVLDPVLDRDFAFYGHSLGAVLAFEVTRALLDRDGKCPGTLFVGASPPPGAPLGGLDEVVGLGDEELVAALAHRFGTADEALAHPELVKLLLPVMRADLEMLATYRPLPGRPLPCPVVAFYGDEDVYFGRDVVAGWDSQTAGSFALEQASGGHFFVADPDGWLRERLKQHLIGEAARAPTRR